ncbi:MAG: hypothetical protein ACC652_05500, partial [Acidimicrobiales bacterium]
MNGTAQAQDSAEEPLDHAALLREIDAEVQRRRTSGDLTPEFERELDLAYAEHAPPTALGGDLDSMLEQFERVAFVDVDAPVESVRRGGAQMKLVLRKAMAFNFRHIAQQIGAIGQAQLMIMRAMRKEQLRLARYVPGASVTVVERIRGLASDPVPLPVGRLAELVGSPSGRVAVVGDGSAEMVSELRANGADAYGVEAESRVRGETAGDPSNLNELIVRRQDYLAHLERLGPEVLSTVVLIMGAVPLADALRSIDLAVHALVCAGRIVIVSEDPSSWEKRLDPVHRDLAVGRPLSAETWAYLLTSSGLESVGVPLLDEPELPDTSEWPASMRAALEPVLSAASGRGVYVVEGTRS